MLAVDPEVLNVFLYFISRSTDLPEVALKIPQRKGFYPLRRCDEQKRNRLGPDATIIWSASPYFKWMLQVRLQTYPQVCQS